MHRGRKISIKKEIYQVLVNRIPGIRYRYHQMRERVNGVGRISAWLYLISLNIGWYIFRIRRICEIPQFTYYEEKNLWLKEPESAISKKKKPTEFANELLKYDVISFDVFDTLIFRPYSDPTDVFYLVGEKMNYMDFRKIRIEMERKIREEKYKRMGSNEVTLYEIHDLLSSETGIDRTEGMQTELDIEYEICFANPYMKEVVEYLRKKGKRLIIISDMYLSYQVIQELLEKNGLGIFDAYYISGDYGVSKNDGKLYKVALNRERTMNIVHIGDNTYSDIQKAKESGIRACLYANVNAVGNIYRPMDMSPITGSIYRGIVNAHIHNGLHLYSWDYEYGYIYGGLFAVGYCQFIHKYVECQKALQPVDKIMFLARDGDILKKVYEYMYPDEKNRTAYVYWSRLVATKLAAKHYKYDYIRRMLYHKVNQGYILDEIFETMEIVDMLPEQFKGEVLTDANVMKVKQWIDERWKEICDHYQDESMAAKQYYAEILNDCERVVAIDIGWAGSGAITLDYIVNHIWNINCEVIGIIAGTNTCHNAEPDMSVSQLKNGKLVSYMYSQEFNRDLWKFHDPNKGDNLYWECLLCSAGLSVKEFCFDENGKWDIRYKDASGKDNESKKALEIQRGIMDFAKDFLEYGGVKGEYPVISGRDAYMPMLIADSYERKYLKQMAKWNERDANI